MTRQATGPLTIPAGPTALRQDNLSDQGQSDPATRDLRQHFREHLANGAVGGEEFNPAV